MMSIQFGVTADGLTPEPKTVGERFWIQISSKPIGMSPCKARRLIGIVRWLSSLGMLIGPSFHHC